jgi:predicted transcriptional regulator
MADLSITAANCLKDAGATTETGVAGETVTAGQSVYKDATDGGKFKKADANGTAAQAVVYGIALNGAAAGQPLTVQKTGDIAIGGTVVVGQTYVQSVNAGGIAPISDIASSSKLSVIGYGKSAALLTLDINPTGITVA